MIQCCECGAEMQPLRPFRRYNDPNPKHVCRKCRAARAGKVNREKAAKHGPAYFSRKSGGASA